MKTKILSGIVIGSLGIIMMQGCLKNENEELQNQEQARLKTYISSKSITVAPTSDGLYYISLIEGTGISPSDSDFVLINVSWYRLDEYADNVLVGTNDTTLARKRNIYPFVSYKGPIKLYMPSSATKGLFEGLKMMKAGGSAKLIVPSSLAYDGYESTNIPKYTTLIMFVDLLKVIKDPIAEDKALIIQYLDTLQLNENDLADGIYMKVDSAGTGDVPSSGDTVTVQYREKSLDTTFSFGNFKYLTSQYIVDKDSIIAGMGVAIRKLKKGSEARIIVPYNMAWGKNGYSGKIPGVMDVPPYTSFYYQIIIKDIGRSNNYK